MELKAVTEEEYKHALESSEECAQQCINSDGIFKVRPHYAVQHTAAKCGKAAQ